MKKKLLYILFLLPIFVIAQDRGELDAYNLKGHIHVISSFEWHVKDSLGKIIKIGYHNEGNLLNGKVNEYNEQGKIFSRMIIDSTLGDGVETYLYNKQGELDSFTFSTSNKDDETKYEYVNSKYTHITYSIDRDGKRKKSEIKTIEKDKTIVKTMDYSGESILFTVTSSYNKQGKLVNLLTEWPDGRKEISTNEWKDGLKITGDKKKYDAVATDPFETTKFGYDDFGNLIRMETTNHKKNLMTVVEYELTLDDHKNYISKKTFLNENGNRRLIYYTERDIIYYK